MKKNIKFYISYANLSCEITASAKWGKYLKKLYGKSTILNFSEKKPNGSLFANLRINEKKSDSPHFQFLTSKKNLQCFEIRTSQHALFIFPALHQIISRIFNILFHLNGGFILHASSILINNQVFIFAGKSGRGKSTIIDFLKNEFADAKILSDNSAFILKIDKSYMIYPSPYMEANRLDLFQQGYQDTPPFKINSIYFPFHHQKNKVDPLNFEQKIKLIQENSHISYSPNILFNKVKIKKFSKTIFEFASLQEMSKLEFTKNTSFIKLLPINN